MKLSGNKGKKNKELYQKIKRTIQMNEILVVLSMESRIFFDGSTVPMI
ncbi:hypothetical protein ACWFPQ_04390 [Peribacillus butanolivorans]